MSAAQIKPVGGRALNKPTLRGTHLLPDAASAALARPAQVGRAFLCALRRASIAEAHRADSHLVGNGDRTHTGTRGRSFLNR